METCIYPVVPNKFDYVRIEVTHSFWYPITLVPHLIYYYISKLNNNFQLSPGDQHDFPPPKYGNNHTFNLRVGGRVKQKK